MDIPIRPDKGEESHFIGRQDDESEIRHLNRDFRAEVQGP